MVRLPVYNMQGTQTGELEVSAEIFGVSPRRTVLHDAVVAGLAARRQGTAHVKTRSEVSGSNRKLWRQKGTGRARVGDRRPPHWTGGGVALGPRMRSHRQRLSRRTKVEALRSALSARARSGDLTVVDQVELAEPKTKALNAVLAALGAQAPTLLVLPEPSEIIWRCGRNIPGLKIQPAADVNCYDVMAARKVIVSKDAIPPLQARLS